VLTSFLVTMFAAFIAPRLVPGVEVRSWGVAAGVAVLFGVANLFFGWALQILLGFVTLPAILLSFGVFLLAIPTIANAILLRVVTIFLPGFRVSGWIAALGMGFLFALASWAAERLRD
jgi:putative membrane protein